MNISLISESEKENRSIGPSLLGIIDPHLSLDVGIVQREYVFVCT